LSGNNVAKPRSGGRQAETVAFLMAADSYPDAHGDVRRIDTHGAMVFLAGQHAYKLKRAVKLPYFDFSTPDLRRRMCERELEINRLTAPALYEGVVPVTRDPESGCLAIGGAGKPVDWLIVMHRFDDDALFDRLAVAGKLDAPLTVQLACKIEQFHRQAPIADTAHWIASLQQVVASLEASLGGIQARAIGVQCLPLLAALRLRFEIGMTLLAERQAAGLVRRCHGDLHLKNIVLLDGMPALFDALEFDEDLATIDVLYDFAFLLMDLWHRNMPAPANLLLNRYYERNPSPAEWKGLALLPLFLALRAAIRAMVGMHGLEFKGAWAQVEAMTEIRRYLALGQTCLAPSPPHIIAIGGFSGTGKTTVSRAVAPAIGAVPGAIHVRSDVERKFMHGVPPKQHLGASAYTAAVTDAVYRRVLAKAGAVLGAGHSVIVDAAFLNDRQRMEVELLARRAGGQFTGLWLEAETAQMVGRVNTRTGDASDADEYVIASQLRTATAPQGWLRIDARGGAAETVALAMAALSAQDV
jgi:aminoglycoside phosphotransferase family enzyme/predicted kinase